jgi:OOP family OmpA-OmpF porin
MRSISKHLPIFAALILAAVLSVMAAALAATVIESTSRQDVRAALDQKGYAWAQVDVDGLQVKLSGLAPSEAQRFLALTAAGSVVDSARVIDSMTVVERDIGKAEFSIEMLRNTTELSLIGLVPEAMDREALKTRLAGLPGLDTVSDLLDTSNRPAPEGWDAAVGFAVDALARLPRSKLSVRANRVAITAVADSADQKRILEADLARKAPAGVMLALDISAPRPAITPFTLRFLVDAEGNAKFDACSADTDEAASQIARAAVAAGLTGKVDCVIGLGAPSPRWGEAAALSISALHDLGGGSVTISDGDVSIVALEGVDKARFDTVTGKLGNRLPDGFSLVSVLPATAAADGAAANAGPPEFVASRDLEGKVVLRGKLRDEREQKVIGSFAQGAFGARHISDATRLAEGLPDDWPLRALAALQALAELDDGTVLMQPEFMRVSGHTSNPDGQAAIARLLSERLGQAEDFKLDITYVEPPPEAPPAMPPDQCVATINAAMAETKIPFAPGAAEIDPSAREVLDKIAETVQVCSEVPMEIAGYTDSQGREEMNLALSQSRAEAVLNALLARRVLTGNLTARGYGELDPIADNGTEAGREANRRIEFHLVKAEPEPSTDLSVTPGDAAAATGAEAFVEPPDPSTMPTDGAPLDENAPPEAGADTSTE